MLMFAEQVVSKDRVAIGSYWCEPHWSEFNFPAYPVGLQIDFSKSNFVARQMVLGMGWNKERPIALPNALTHTNNDYPFVEIAGAFESGEMESRRLSGEQVDHHGPSLLLERLKTDTGSLINVRQRVESGAELSFQQATCNDEGRQIELRAKMNPLPIQLGELGASVTLGERKLRVERIEGQFPEQIRNCEVQFSPVGVNDFPVRITVKDAQDSLRSVSCSSFQHLSGEQVDKAIDHIWSHARFDNSEIAWRELLLRYWLQQPDLVSEADKNNLRRLKERFSNGFAVEAKTGDRLKLAHMLTMISLILGETQSADLWFDTKWSFIYDDIIYDNQFYH